MSRNPSFINKNSGTQLTLFLLLCLLGILIGTGLGFLFVYLVYGYGPSAIGQLMANGITEGLPVIRMIQVVSHIGIFVLPPLLFALMVAEKPLALLGFTTKTATVHYLPYLLLMFACLPFIYALSEWNRAISLPDALSWVEQWMQEKEMQAEKMRELFLGVTSIGGLLFNLFMVAVLPSLGEELLFRGVLQPLLGRFFRNVHAGIIVTSLLFGMIHLQFYSLLPMFVLGLFLGYAYYLTKNIWVPILMHFVNNAAAIIVYFLWHNGYITVDMEGFGGGGGWPSIVFSLLACVVLWMVSVRNASKAQTV